MQPVPLVVLAAAVPWSGTTLTDQHLAHGLARYADVLYVDPTTSFLTRFRNPAAAKAAAPPGVDLVEPGVYRIGVRVAPFKERRGGKGLALALTRRAMRRAVATFHGRPVHACIISSLDPLFGAVGERNAVLYATDDYLSGARLMGVSAARLNRLARLQPRRADVVVAASPVIAESMRALGVNPILIPNGVDVEHFARTPEPAAGKPLVAFVGHLSERVDVGLLEAVAHAGVRLRIIGPRQTTLPAGHFDALSGPRVEWIGPLPYAQLPEYLADVTTCLVPYADSAFNRASFPLKILEYLAAGRRVVATDLPAVRWLDTDLIEVAATSDAFTRAVKSTLATPLGGAEMRQRREFAAQHSWTSRVATLAQAIGLEERQS